MKSLHCRFIDSKEKRATCRGGSRGVRGFGRTPLNIILMVATVADEMGGGVSTEYGPLWLVMPNERKNGRGLPRSGCGFKKFRPSGSAPGQVTCYLSKFKAEAKIVTNYNLDD